jgi:hypothetical protein
MWQESLADRRSVETAENVSRRPGLKPGTPALPIALDRQDPREIWLKKYFSVEWRCVRCACNASAFRVLHREMSITKSTPGSGKALIVWMRETE